MKLPEKMRLQRMIALSSEMSRRVAEEAIAGGYVTVNGLVVTAPGTTVNPLSDVVHLRGRKLEISTRRTYLAYHKPKGQIVTKSDPEGRPTIWKDLAKWKDRLNAVGRLDFDSEGLLLLSDDGDFINLLTHPRHEIWKTYRVWIRGELGAADISELKNGIELDDGKTLPANVKIIRAEENNSFVEICIREGRNRQVRRMLEAIGCHVRSLKRTAVGPVKIGRLKAGQWRELKPDEVEKLISMAKGIKRSTVQKPM